MSSQKAPRYYQGVLLNMLIDANEAFCANTELIPEKELETDLFFIISDRKNLPKRISAYKNQNSGGSYLSPKKYDRFARTLYDIICKKRGWSQSQFVDHLISELNEFGRIPFQSAQKMSNIRTDYNRLIEFMISLFGHEVATGDTESHQDFDFPKTILDQYITINENDHTVEDLIDIHAAPKTRLIITAPSGQGKTLFLKRLQKHALESNLFSFVLYVPLADCVLENASSCVTGEGILIKVINDVCSTQYGTKFVTSHRSIRSSDKLPLLLFDGYNELQLSDNVAAVKQIKQDISHINKNWKNAHIIITTTALDTPIVDLVKKDGAFEYFRVGTLSGVPAKEHNEIIANKQLSAEMQDLARIPFFYNLINETTTPAETKYRLLFNAYSSLAARKKEEVSVTSPPDYLYHLIFPYIALQMNISREHKIGSSLIKQRIEDLLDRKRFHTALFDESARKQNSDAKTSVFRRLNESSALNDLMFEGLLSEGLIEKGEKGYIFAEPFTHMIWRDFLAAYAAKCSLYALSGCYDNPDALQEYSLSLNLTPQAIELLLDTLTENLPITGVFEELFDFKALPSYAPLLAYIHLAHNAYQFVFYLHLEDILEEKLHSVLSFVCKRLQLLNDLSPIDCSNHQREVARIVGHECEYLCGNKNYEKALELIDFCDSILSDEKRLAILHNQKALIFLNCLHMDTIGESFSNILPIVYKQADLANEAYRLLQLNSDIGYEYSLNIHGFMKAFPASFLLSDPIEVNPATALILFYRCATGNKSPAGIYALRQALELLLCGYVTVTEWDPEQKILSPKTVLNQRANPLHIPPSNIALAQDLLKYAEEYDAPMLNYFRGCVADTDEEKKHFFSSALEDECRLLYHIRSNYDFGDNYDLGSEYALLAENIKTVGIGKFNRKHPIYIYIAAKRLELAYNTKRTAFFESFEQLLSGPLFRLVKLLTE